MSKWTFDWRVYLIIQALSAPFVVMAIVLLTEVLPAEWQQGWRGPVIGLLTGAACCGLAWLIFLRFIEPHWRKEARR